MRSFPPLQFCQPTGYALSTQQQQPVFYVAVLTDIDADRHYCATFTFYETVAMTPTKPDDVDADDHDSTLIHHSLMYAPKSLVLVSRLDYFEAFRVGVVGTCVFLLCLLLLLLLVLLSCSSSSSFFSSFFFFLTHLLLFHHLLLLLPLLLLLFLQVDYLARTVGGYNTG